jgi:hypothetical protein
MNVLKVSRQKSGLFIFFQLAEVINFEKQNTTDVLEKHHNFFFTLYKIKAFSK